jgi:hypothetical protein
MVNDSDLDRFIKLFRGRGDCYGSWEGGCVRERLTEDVFRQHLADGPHIGVYPVVPFEDKTLCVWGCSDIDYDGPDDAWLLHDAFMAVNVTSWVEKTRRGYHVWVFCDELVEAKHMRRMFLAAHKVAELNPKEVNPKQETLARGQVGNYVRLPYPSGYSATERVIVGRKIEKIDLSDFLEMAHGSMVSKDVVIQLSDYYVPPTIEYTAQQPTMDMMEASRRLTPLGRTIFKDGPIVGRDRSTTLTHLAHECRKAGLAPEDALIILEDADTRWGKYLMRGEAGRKELIKLLERAYGHTPSS